MANKKNPKKTKQANTWLAFVLLLVIAMLMIMWLYPKKNSGIRQSVVKPEPKTLPGGELQFIGKDGTVKANLLIEIAQDDYSRSKGLMLRRDLAENQGMLFIFEQEGPQAFWMKNTPLSLDMIFVNAKKEIVQIHKYTKPQSTQTYFSGKPAQFVVETVAGFTDRYEIKIGDKITWRWIDETAGG